MGCAFPAWLCACPLSVLVVVDRPPRILLFSSPTDVSFYRHAGYPVPRPTTVMYAPNKTTARTTREAGIYRTRSKSTHQHVHTHKYVHTPSSCKETRGGFMRFWRNYLETRNSTSYIDRPIVGHLRSIRELQPDPRRVTPRGRLGSDAVAEIL